MKTEGETKRKIQQATYRHLKKQLASRLKKVPENCRYNRSPRSATGKALRPMPRICIHAIVAGVVCDKSSESSTDFKICPFFTARKSKETLKSEFIGMAKGDRARVAEHMPDVAALMWVLDMEGGVSEADAESAVNGDEADEPASVPPRPAAPQIQVITEGQTQARGWRVVAFRWWQHRAWPWNWRRKE